MSKKAAGRKVGIYARVSTDGQTVENQLRDLRAVAKRERWKIVKVFRDDGISSPRETRTFRSFRTFGSTTAATSRRRQKAQRTLSSCRYLIH